MIYKTLFISIVFLFLIKNLFFEKRICRECGIMRFSYQLKKDDLGCNMCNGGD